MKCVERFQPYFFIENKAKFNPEQIGSLRFIVRLASFAPRVLLHDLHRSFDPFAHFRFQEYSVHLVLVQTYSRTKKVQTYMGEYVDYTMCNSIHDEERRPKPSRPCGLQRHIYQFGAHVDSLCSPYCYNACFHIQQV